MILSIVAIIAIVLFPLSASADIVVNQTGAEISVLYTEPALNADGTSLTDLHHTYITYDIGDGPVTATTVPATTPTGGGKVETTFIIPIEIGTEKDATFHAIAVDNVGNESEPSDPIVRRIDLLAPAKIQ